MNERIKEVRKALHMRQDAFGARIGMSQSAITAYETGFREPINAVIKAICREFNISETWLRTGEGEMFNTEIRDALDEILVNRGLGDGERALVEQFLYLDPADREVVTRFIVRAAESIMKADGTLPKTLEEIFGSEEGRAAFEAGMDAEE